MSECKHRRQDGVCLRDLEYVYKGFCVDGPCNGYEPQTNADRITSSVEALALFIADIADCAECEEMHGFRMCDAAPEKACEKCWAGWLRKEIEA